MTHRSTRSNPYIVLVYYTQTFSITPTFLIIMNQFNISGNKGENWENVSGTVRALSAKIMAASRAAFERFEFQILFYYLITCTLLLTSFVYMHPAEKCCFVFVIALFLSVWNSFVYVSHSEKEYASSKYARRETSKEKQKIRNLKKVLKTSSPEKRKRLEKKIVTLDSHSEIEITKWSLIQEIILKTCTDEHSRKFLTSALLCCITVCNTKNNIGAISSIMQFANSEFGSNQGCVMDIWNTLMSLNNTEGAADMDALISESEKEDANDCETFIARIQDARNNWKLFRTCPAYTKFHELLCTFVACGLIEGKEYDLSVGNIKIFAADTRRETMHALDALDAIIACVTYLLESGIYAFAKKSLKPFLFEDKLAYEIDEEYASLAPMVQTISTGNLEKMFGITDKALEERIGNLGKSILRAKMGKAGVVASILQRKYENVIEWENTVIQTRIACGTREAPFAPVLIGDSNIGKTTLTQIFAREIGARNGFKTTSRYQCVIQGNDKYWTAYKGYTEVVILDDFGNTKPQHMDEDEGAKQIMIKNNQVCYAPKAGVEEKGRVPVQPKLMLINTNNETMLSEMSVCPYSRMRRGDIYIRASVKHEFAREVNGSFSNEIDTTKVNKAFTKFDENGKPYVEFPTLPSLWTLRLQKPIIKKAEKTDGKKGSRADHDAKIMLVDTVPGKTYDIYQALDAVSAQASDFYLQQKGIVEMNKKMDEDYTICPCGCKKSKIFCENSKPKLTSESLLSITLGCIVSRMWHKAQNFKIGLVSFFDEYEDNLCKATTKYLLENYDQWYHDGLIEAATYIPIDLEENFFGKILLGTRVFSTVTTHHKTMMKWKLFTPLAGLMTASTMLVIAYPITFVMLALPNLFLTCFTLNRYRHLGEEAKAHLLAEIADRKKSLEPLALEQRQKYGKYLFYGITGAATLVVTLKVLKILKSLWDDKKDKESLLRPNTMSDIEERNALPNEWADNTIGNLKKGTASRDQLNQVVRRNLIKCQVFGTDSNAKSCALILHAGLLVMPKHNLVPGWNRVRISRPGFYLDIPLCDQSVYQCPDRDLVFIYSANIRGRDISKHLRAKNTNTSVMRLLPSPLTHTFVNDEGEYVSQDLHGTWSNEIKASEGSFCGWNYPMKEASFVGSCGSALVIRDGAQWVLGGIHLAGNGHVGAGGSICEEDMIAARAHFNELPDIAEMGMVPTTIIGDSEAIKFQAVPKDTSPLVWREGDNHHEYIGSCKGENSFYSSVKPSLITDTVTEVTGIKNNYGPPRTKPWWRPYHLDLDKRSNQPVGFKIGELADACKEYVDNFCVAYETLPIDVADTFVKRPLTNHEIVFGVKGLRFIDRMNFSTSIGFPYTGKKTKYCIMEGEDVVDFKPEIWEEVSKVERMLRNGFRAYQPFKTSLKDEITKQFKADGSENQKVRVFACSPITLQILIRKYFLPVACALSHLPLDSEQAVGINASGPDFHELIEHIRSNGEKTGYVAGDFSKYDLGMSSNAIIMAFFAMRKIAERLWNFNTDDLLMMDMLANEVANPMLAYNGEMVLMAGSNPSGHSMTVYVNGIVNSLYHRCVFNRLKKEHNLEGNFSSECKATFYGDDSLLAPSERVAEHVHFNAFSKVFKDVGIGYTAADKSENAPDLVTMEQIDFLKRKPVFNPHLQQFMGALDFGSIIKSLHCNATDTLPADTASAINLDGSIREMFNHGREPYEEWRTKVQTIAAKHDLGPQIKNLDVTYDQYLEHYIGKYVRNKEDTGFSVSSDEEEE